MNLYRRLIGGGEASIARARRPQELAASLEAAPREGLDWLGRPPSAQASGLYRLVIGLALAILHRVFRVRVVVEGRDHLPEGGYVAICALHRSWVDPLLVVEALPRAPRPWFMGSGATAFDRPWKERLLHRTGGLLPVWRGGTDVSAHVRTAAAVLDERAVLALFAEGAIGGTSDEPARMRSGAALLCLRTDAPIVPIAICGAEELYRGKRVSVRILEPMAPSELLDELPEPGSRDELRAARDLTRAVSERLAQAVRADYPTTVDPPAMPRRWRWLTRLMR